MTISTECLETETLQDGPLETQYESQIRLWALRMLYRLKGYRGFEKLFVLDEQEIAEFLGISLEPETEEEEDKKLSPALLKDVLIKIEGNYRPGTTTLGLGLDMLAEALALSDVERDILEFTMLLRTCSMLEDIADALGSSMDLATVGSILSVVLDRPRNAVGQALHHEGALASSGLLRVDSDLLKLRYKLDLAEGLIDKLAVAHATSLDVLGLFLRRAPEAILSSDDYSECQSNYLLVSRYLAAAVTHQISGVNILLYGPPGVGKTEMVRTLSQELKIALFEIRDQDDRGRACSPEERFSAYQLSQVLLEKQECCAILFDEIEDVFPKPNEFSHGRYSRHKPHESKAWVNKLLDSNPVPSIWVGNAVSHIDPAYLRRFDVVVELCRPGRDSRRRVLEKYLKGVSIPCDNWLDKAADNPHITPGLIERAAKVIGNVGTPDEVQAAELFDQLTGGVLKAMGEEPKRSHQAESSFSYRVDLLNADIDPKRIAHGLKQQGEGRALLYGPPGTGKSALAHYFAKTLEKPLVARKASDILGKYVGMTEQNLASAFGEAESQGAVLLLDEIDSLMRTRAGANHSWEISQVNELLVQMESFKGVLIACTNAFDILDPAAVRRFDLKVRFDYLAKMQVWSMFVQVLEDHGCTSLEAGGVLEHRLSKLTMLTPGDFNAVVRRLRITGEPVTDIVLLEALEQECSSKVENRGRGIGFSAML